MASVTRRSSASGDESERADCRFEYVSGALLVVVAARVSSVNRRSLCSWLGESWGNDDARAASVGSVACLEAVEDQNIHWYSAHVPHANSSSRV